LYFCYKNSLIIAKNQHSEISPLDSFHKIVDPEKTHIKIEGTELEISSINSVLRIIFCIKPFYYGLFKQKMKSDSLTQINVFFAFFDFARRY